MKKLLGILVLGLLWCNIGLTADIFYNSKLKRIYILGEQLEKNDHFSIKKYANEGGESIFISSPGGYGWVEIGALVRKKKLPVFVGRHCYSACTYISLSSPTLYASEDSMFMFHDPRMKKYKSTKGEQIEQQKVLSEYKRAGATQKFIDKIIEAREKDTSTFDQDWELWLGCNDIKKYFTKNEIFCDSVSSTEGIKFIVENNPNIINIYCSNNKEKKIIKLFFQPSCPAGPNWEEIEKNEFELLKGNFNIISENDTHLVYHYDYSEMDMLIHEISKLTELGISFDYDELAKKYGFKSFKDAVNKYKKKTKTKVSVKEVKAFFEKVDINFKINYSQKNLDKLHNLIFNNKRFKKQNTYLKAFKKGKWKGKKIDQLKLAVYINVEKEMAKLTKDPSLETITPFVWWWSYRIASKDESFNANAIIECTKSAAKYKLIGGKCIIVDWRNIDTGEVKNMLKPIL